GEGEDRGAVDVDGSTVVATRSPMPAQADRSHAHRMPGDGGGMRRDGTGLPFGAACDDPGPGPIGQERRQPHRARSDDARTTVEGLIGEERIHALQDARWAADRHSRPCSGPSGWVSDTDDAGPAAAATDPASPS